MRTIAEADLVARSRVVMEKPFGTDHASARRAQRPAARGVRRGADLPHRPLPREGGRPEHPRVPLRQRPLRADLAPEQHLPHRDRRPRDPRPHPARRLLRGHRRLPRHGGHAPVPDPRVHGHGAADLARTGGDQPGEEQGLPLDAADPADGRRARAVHRLPRRARRRPGLGDRDLRRAQVLRRQLAVGGRAVLPAHRQADGGGGAHHLDRLPRAPAVDVPARLGRRRQRPRPPHLRPRRQVADVVVLLREASGPGLPPRQAVDAVLDARDELGRRRPRGLRAAHLRRGTR